MFVGLRVILDSSDGQLVRRVTDPAAPGYEAVLEPTPTNLVISVDAAGKLDSATIMSLTSDGVGGVMTVPAGTVVPLGTGALSLRYIYDNLGQEAFKNSLGGLLDLTFGDTQVVAAADWAGLVGPAAPITVVSPDPVAGPNGTVLFPKGSIELQANQVWPYISGRGAQGERPQPHGPPPGVLEGLARPRSARWAPAALNIPTDAGLGHFLAELSADQVQYLTLPVTRHHARRQGQRAVPRRPDAIAEAVASIIPFPEGAPGARPRLRVLDGTGKLDNGVSAAIVLGAAGAQIDVVGNARSFGQATTAVRLLRRCLRRRRAEVARRPRRGRGGPQRADQLGHRPHRRAR